MRDKERLKARDIVGGKKDRMPDKENSAWEREYCEIDTGIDRYNGGVR